MNTEESYDSDAELNASKNAVPLSDRDCASNKSNGTELKRQLL